MNIRTCIVPAIFLCLVCVQATAQTALCQETRVVINNQGWELIGDLRLPDAARPMPVVLMFNQAAGNRRVYRQLAERLAERGIASLRIDLRGHGESVNQGQFIPGEHRRDPLIWDAEQDVAAVHAYFKTHAISDSSRIGIIGASYSGEEMAEAGRMHGFASAYAVLSPGSFTEASIQQIDGSEAPWLFVTSREDYFLTEITASLMEQSKEVEIIMLPGKGHATNLLDAHGDLSERLAIWFAERLK